MKNIAVLLSGNGVYDGAEINEAVLTLLAVEEAGLNYQCFAPDREQYHVINHITGEEMPERRNILVESARIARGNVKPIVECNSDDFSALIVVGGFGVAKNLSDFAFKGQEMSVQSDVLKVCTDFKNNNKPAGYMCIAPALLPSIYGEGIALTVGNDTETVKSIEANGGKHKVAAVDQIVVDEQYNVVTTPAYMLASSLSEAKLGIDSLVRKIKEII